jgi:hypothetical protein
MINFTLAEINSLGAGTTAIQLIVLLLNLHLMFIYQQNINISGTFG